LDQAAQPTRPAPNARCLSFVLVFADLVLTPGLILAMWAGGMAAGVALVAKWEIVGPGFFWVAGATILLVGAWTVPNGGAGAWVGVVGVVIGSLLARRSTLAAVAFGLGSVGFVFEAASYGNVWMAITGAIALGGVTDEMLLGHWYLVDPKLPRWALKRLDLVAALALVADGVLLLLAGATVGSVVGWAFIALAAMSTLLMVGVWFSLKEPAYAGVMAATGLSYLAVLTALGATVAGRSMIGDAANQLAASILRG